MIHSTYAEVFNQQFVQDPFPTYAALRTEAPVHRITLPDGRGLWMITRFEDVKAALKDPRFIKNWRKVLTPEEQKLMPVMPPVVQLLFKHLLAIDPPDHTRIRGMVHKAFTPQLVEQLRPRIQQIADELLDAMLAGPRSTDLLTAYAFPLPLTVIAELLGIPLDHREKFRYWSGLVVTVDPSPDRFTRMAGEMEEFGNYLRELFAIKRANPTNDLTSALVQVEEAGDKLTEQEMFSLVFFLLIAGHETTVNLIGNGMLALLQHPEQLKLLRENPDMIRNTVEELLRFDSPVETSTLRWAREDVEFAGATIPRGEQVLAVITSANRDPNFFAEPDQLDITRSEHNHIAFGHGIHYCLGAPLARLEGAIAINSLVQRLPNLRLAVPAQDLIWRPGMLIRGMIELPVEF
ncbi:cytochrome P450 family protein [Herpetosiphon llansteffanensis]|uniref:cytochrome P450 family protein n=1 Tax=Herpetosiphon llansteffanensis TaxID=2094568 RepID=UPI000D7D1414|nr:cytochrome P450 [Herpetosiphon llansteffanensis]